jgi:hypothetical protein
MAERAVKDILDDWRTAERALANADERDEREKLEARTSELREEHGAALAARDAEADMLRGRDEEATEALA